MSLTSVSYTAQSNPTHTLVMLHGWGANAQDLAPIAPMLGSLPIHVLFPNAPHPHPLNPSGLMWYDLETGEHLAQTRLQLKDWILSLPEQTNLPLAKTILGGFSQGGAMTLDVGYELPLAGLISLSGYLHPNVASKTTFQFKPILMIHGKQDTVVPLQMAKSAYGQLKTAGLLINYYELDMAHEVTPDALKIMQSFLSEIVNS